jgi:hypothetical protein
MTKDEALIMAIEALKIDQHDAWQEWNIEGYNQNVIDACEEALTNTEGVK